MFLMMESSHGHNTRNEKAIGMSLTNEGYYDDNIVQLSMLSFENAKPRSLPNTMLEDRTKQTLLELDAEDGDEDGHVERDDDREDGANAAEDGNIEADEDVGGDGENGADKSTNDLTKEHILARDKHRIEAYLPERAQQCEDGTDGSRGADGQADVDGTEDELYSCELRKTRLNLLNPLTMRRSATS